MTAITSTDLDNAKLDVDHIAAIATSTALTAVDRLGHVKNTVAGAVYTIQAFNNRGAWVTATAYSVKDLVSFSGTWYVAVVAHTSSAAFATDSPTKWRVYQGIISSDLAASTGSTLVGHGAGTVATKFTSVDASISALAATSGNYNDESLTVNALSSQLLGDLSAYRLAILSGTVTVVFYGDSITEGVSQVCYEDSWAGVLEHTLRSQNPSVTWNFINYSLAGRGIQNAADSGYNGKASPDDAPVTSFYHAAVGGGTGLWPTASVIGKSWRDHVKDAAPDIVFVAFGANDISGDADSWATFLKTIRTFCGTFTKVPSLVAVPTTLPVAADPTFGPLTEKINVTAVAARGVAKELNFSVIDANRMQQFLRDGFDISNEKYSQELDFYQYPAGWTTISGSPVVASSQLSGISIIRRDRAVRNVRHTCKFNFANYTTGVPGMWYRVDGTLTNKGYALQVVSGTTAILYFNLVSIASTVLSVALVNGQDVSMEIEVVGAHHKCWVNGQKVIDLFDYKSLTTGYGYIQIAGSTGTAKSLTMRFGVPTVVGNPKFSDVALFGLSNDFTANPSSVGGDAIHHPSKVGHSVMYVGAAAGFLEATKDAVLLNKVNGFATTVNDSSWVPGVNDYIDLRIAGTSAGNALVSGASGALNASSSNTAIVTGGTTVVVDVVQNSTTVRLTRSLVLPLGSWLINASAHVSQNGAGVRHLLTVNAVRLL